MDANAEMRGAFRVDRELNRVVECGDREHRALRDRHAAHQLGLALLLHITRPRQGRDLKFQRIHFTLPLLGIRFDADPEAIQGHPNHVSSITFHRLRRHPARVRRANIGGCACVAWDRVHMVAS